MVGTVCVADHGVLIKYADLTNKATYEKVEFWIDELLTNEENCDIYIVGTKST